MSLKVMRGIVHGKVIELDDEAGMSDGQQVEVIIRDVAPKGRQPGEGFLRTEGALADDPEWDAIMEEIQESRKLERRPHDCRIATRSSRAGLRFGLC